MKKKVLLINIATNKYINFLDSLYQTSRKYFLVDHDVSFLLFTDKKVKVDGLPLKISHIEHEPWPAPTLKRSNYFLREKKFISQFDYVFYCDADMVFVDYVDDTIFSELTLTQHVRDFTFHDTNIPCSFEHLSYDRSGISTAHVDPCDENRYYAGGFLGGSSKRFLQMSGEIAKNVLIDEENNVVAEWHDESHLNRYAIDNPPEKMLPINYCCPEWPEFINHMKIKPKIIALNKNHSEYQQ